MRYQCKECHQFFDHDKSGKPKFCPNHRGSAFYEKHRAPRDTRNTAKNSRKWHLKHRFNMTPEDLEAMRAAQGDRCACCGDSFVETQAPHIDHDHACCPTERSCGRCVRAILCGPCNKGLGHFYDDPSRLLAAASYLISFQAKAVA